MMRIGKTICAAIPTNTASAVGVPKGACVDNKIEIERSGCFFLHADLHKICAEKKVVPPLVDRDLEANALISMHARGQNGCPLGPGKKKPLLGRL